MSKGRNAGSVRSAASGRGGYTLMEIMIVVLIIALLTGIAAYSTLRARQVAKTKQAETELAMIAAAVDQLAWDTGRWPRGIMRNVQGNAETWDLTTGAAGLLANDGRFPDWNGPYITRISKDPWGSDYFFDPDYTSSGHVYAVVGSFGPNRRGRNVYDSDDLFLIMK